MLTDFHLLRGIIKSNEITVIMLAFDEGITSPSRRYDEFVKKNLGKLNGTVGSDWLQERRTNMFSCSVRKIDLHKSAKDCREGVHCR